MTNKHKARKRRIQHIKSIGSNPRRAHPAMKALCSPTVTPEDLFLIRDSLIPKRVQNDFFYKMDGEEFCYHEDAIREIEFAPGLPYSIKCAAYYILRMNPGFFVEIRDELPMSVRPIALTNLIKALSLAKDPNPDL